MWPLQRYRNLQHRRPFTPRTLKENPMGGVIYLVGLVVIVMFILSVLGLR
jgi:hypothetical protein